LKRALVVLGAVFAIIGIFLCVFSILPVSDSTDWFDQSFIVPEYGHCYLRGDFYSLEVNLKISFDTTQGAVNFYVMDETEYIKYNSSLTFNYYQAPSAPSVTQMDKSWIPPTDKTIYFVWDNTGSYETKSVSALFQLEYSHPILSPVITSLGLLILFGGLSTMSLGYRFPSPDSSRITIIVGYIFASLGGLIGIFIGADLSNKQNLEDKLHGKIITTLGVIATIIYLLLLARTYIF
jgi:hypothetical protein